jgi:hypothetical protein
MAVVGLATTNPADAIAPLSDLVVSDFQQLQLEDLEQLVHNKFVK